MFKKRLYESAETLVYDPVVSNGNGTRASLTSLSFRKVELAASLDILEAALKAHSPDLLLAELAGTEPEICRVMQSVRQGLLAWNPFTMMIVTTRRRDGSVVGQVLNSGADDLIARPFSTMQLGERIKALIDRRKRFVVTNDYIGPDRRRDPDRSGAECFDVPNPLRLRAMDGLADDQAEHRIAEDVERGKEMLNPEKLRRDAIQLCMQWRLLGQRPPGSPEFLVIMSRLEKVVTDIKRRAASNDAESAAGWCDSIIASVQTVTKLKCTAAAESAANFKPPLHLLGQAVNALGQMFAPGETMLPIPAHLDGRSPGSDTRRPAA